MRFCQTTRPVTRFGTLTKNYKALILPDETRITPDLEKRLREHLDRGGKIISSMYSGLQERPDKKNPPGMEPVKHAVHTANQNASAPPEFASDSAAAILPAPNDRFVFPEWGVTYSGIAPFDPLFMQSDRIGDFPEMPVTVIARSSFVTPSPGTEVLANYIAPYFNRQPKNVRFFQYLPPKDPCGQAAVTLSEQVAHVAFPLFAAYFESGRLEYKKIIAHLLNGFLPEPLVRAPGALSFVKVFVTRQKQRIMVHLISGIPENRTPQLEVIEDQIPVCGMKLEVRTNCVSRIYTVPEKQDVQFTRNGKYAAFTVPDFCGHTIVAIECGGEK